MSASSDNGVEREMLASEEDLLEEELEDCGDLSEEEPGSGEDTQSTLTNTRLAFTYDFSNLDSEGKPRNKVTRK